MGSASTKCCSVRKVIDWRGATDLQCRKWRVCPVATLPINRENVSRQRLVNFEDAMAKLSRDDRFRATIYAMNTLLVQKGIYSPEEFEFQFRQFAQKHLND